MKNLSFHKVVDERVIFVRQIVLKIKFLSFCSLYSTLFDSLSRDDEIVAPDHFLLHVFPVELEVCFCIVNSESIGRFKVI